MHDAANWQDRLWMRYIANMIRRKLACSFGDEFPTNTKARNNSPTAFSTKPAYSSLRDLFSVPTATDIYASRSAPPTRKCSKRYSVLRN